MSQLAAAAQTVLNNDGLSDVLVEALPDAWSPRGRLLRLLVRGASLEVVLRAASEIVRADVGAKQWQFVSGSPPNPDAPANRRFSAVLHTAD